MQKSFTSPVSKSSRAAVWVGRALSGFALLFLVFDTVIKLIQSPFAVEPTVGLGFRADQVVIIGVIELLCIALYAFPRTAVLGAMLMTGYLGGAVAINFRAGMPAFNIIFPFIIGALVWGGLMLREKRLWSLLPFRS
jgi:hypothetical protein